MASEAEAEARARLADRGMQVVAPDAGLAAALQPASRTLTEEWLARAGEDGARLLEAYRRA